MRLVWHYITLSISGLLEDHLVMMLTCSLEPVGPPGSYCWLAFSVPHKSGYHQSIHFVISQSFKAVSLEAWFFQSTESFHVQSYYQMKCSLTINLESWKSSFSMVTTLYSGLVIFCHLCMISFLASWHSYKMVYVFQKSINFIHLEVDYSRKAHGSLTKFWNQHVLSYW